MDYELFKSVTRDTKAQDERIERLEKQRLAAMEKCRYIADSARGNRTTNATRNIGTLTMVFGGATSIGLLILKEPSLSTLFGAVAIVGIAVYGNKRLHKNTTLKMNMHKQMVKMADERHDELAILNVKESDLTEIPMPKYAHYQEEVRKFVAIHKKEILGKANFKIMQSTISRFAIAAGLSAMLNYTEKNNITNFEPYLIDKIKTAQNYFNSTTYPINGVFAP